MTSMTPLDLCSWYGLLIFWLPRLPDHDVVIICNSLEGLRDIFRSRVISAVSVVQRGGVLLMIQRSCEWAMESRPQALRLPKHPQSKR
jgi:hypothetical protein